MSKLTPPQLLVIPYELVANKNISPLDERIYGIVYWLTKLKGEKCTASNQALAKVACSTPRSVQRGLNKLQEHGYIERLYQDEKQERRAEIRPLIEFTHMGGRPNSRSPRPNSHPRGRPNSHQNNSSPLNNSSKEYLAEQSSAENETSEGQQINEVITMFQAVNPGYDRFFPQKTQRDAAQYLLKKLGKEKLHQIINEVLPAANRTQYAPTVTTPNQLAQKLGQLAAWTQKKTNNTPKVGKV